MTNSCMNCGLANWHRTKTGALHPSGDGRCTWKFVPAAIPKSRYYVGGYSEPSGGNIDRKSPCTDCPTWEAKQ